MAESWRQADIVCPFFRNEDEKNKSINCEGIVEGSVICSRFRSPKKREKQLSTFCENQYQDCVVYQAILKAKYSED